MSKSQRTKGAAGEREICHLIEENTGVKVRRNLQQYQVGGTDIVAGRYAIEAKRRKSLKTIYDFWHQAEDEAARIGKTPVLWMRADGERWLVTMTPEEFLRLAREEIAE